jgi:hypothetical protein
VCSSNSLCYKWIRINKVFILHTGTRNKSG